MVEVEEYPEEKEGSWGSKSATKCVQAMIKHRIQISRYKISWKSILISDLKEENQ